MGKPALVLLHGFCENQSLWEHITPQLKYEGKIITPDLPGFGNSPALETNFTIDEIASKIHTDLVRQGVERCICIGHSLGGYVTLAFKKQFPEFVTGLGLIHSTAFADSEEKKEGRNKLIEFLNKNPARMFLSSFAHTLFCETNKENLRSEIEKVVGMSKGLEGRTIQAYALAMRDRDDNISILVKESAPLFVAGVCDSAVPIESSKEQISLIKVKKHCYMLENTAHMGMYENPEVVIRAINTFINE